VDGALAGKQVATLHIAASDGILSWDEVIIGEDDIQYFDIDGSFNSVTLADMNGDGAVNGLDVTPFVQVLTNLAAYQAARPGLDGVARGNINGDNDANGLDVTPFVGCVTGGGCPPGGGAIVAGGGSVVPEPTSFLLVVLGSMMVAFFGRRSR
jgi:hypothetical protein